MAIQLANKHEAWVTFFAEINIIYFLLRLLFMAWWGQFYQRGWKTTFMDGFFKAAPLFDVESRNILVIWVMWFLQSVLYISVLHPLGIDQHDSYIGMLLFIF